MKARQLIEEAATAPNVVMVYEAGTMDAFTALYIDGKLVVTDVRGDVSNVLAALKITPQEVFVAKGFDGNFPPKLSQLKLVAPR